MLSQAKNTNVSNVVNESLMEKVILQNDLSGLTSIEKVQHVRNVCISLGLNPLTKPIQLHKFQGKEVMYMGKDGAEQLRNLHDVSIVKLETEVLKGDLYVVKAYATKSNGRQDCSTSAISIANLKGEAIGNAMKKCETQAKRRVTLSICGLGMLDESELDDLPKGAYKPHIKQAIQSAPQIIKQEDIEDDSDNLELDFSSYKESIKNAENIDSLQSIFDLIKKRNFKSRPDLFKQLIDAKDIRKNELAVKEFQEEYDAETGEINDDPVI